MRRWCCVPGTSTMARSCPDLLLLVSSAVSGPYSGCCCCCSCSGSRSASGLGSRATTQVFSQPRPNHHTRCRRCRRCPFPSPCPRCLPRIGSQHIQHPTKRPARRARLQSPAPASPRPRTSCPPLGQVAQQQQHSTPSPRCCVRTFEYSARVCGYSTSSSRISRLAASNLLASPRLLSLARLSGLCSWTPRSYPSKSSQACSPAAMCGSSKVHDGEQFLQLPTMATQPRPRTSMPSSSISDFLAPSPLYAAEGRRRDAPSESSLRRIPQNLYRNVDPGQVRGCHRPSPFSFWLYRPAPFVANPKYSGRDVTVVLHDHVTVKRDH